MHFTVVTPTHQRRALLPEAVASVRTTISAPLNFSFEHLVFDNGSRDGTAAYLRRAAAQPGAPLRHWHHAARRPRPLRLAISNPARNAASRLPGRALHPRQRVL